MGLEDRDWYREETAKKKGMRYNAKNATYSSGEKLFSDAVRSRSSVRGYFPGLFKPFSLRLLLQICFTLVIFGFIFVILKIIFQLAR